jgi:hypothetical protein
MQCNPFVKKVPTRKTSQVTIDEASSASDLAAKRQAPCQPGMHFCNMLFYNGIFSKMEKSDEESMLQDVTHCVTM